MQGVYDGYTMKLYINEQLNSNVSYNQGIYSGNNDLSIGNSVGGNPNWFNGIIDEVTITGDNVPSIPPPLFPFLITFNTCSNGNDGSCAGFRPLSGTWAVQNQAYTTHPPIANYLSTVNNITCSDCVIETKIKISSSDVGFSQGILFRVANVSNYYLLAISNEYDIVQFRRYSPADDPTYGRSIGHINTRIDPDRWYTLKVRISGDTFTGYLNGSEVLTVSDSTFTEGMMGLYAHRTDVAFDDFSAQRNVVINITNIGGSSISPLLQRQGNPLAVQFAFQPNALYFNATTLPPETVVGELALTVPFLVNQPYYLRYYIEPREFNTPLSYAFENFGFMPRMLFATLHFNEVASFYVMADQNARATVPVVKASLDVPYYIQALVYNGNEFVLSDGYKVMIH